MKTIQYDIFGNVVKPKLCKCGCGEPLYDQKHHKYYGSPDYIHGHNSTGVEHSEETLFKMSQARKKWMIENPDGIELLQQKTSLWRENNPDELKKIGENRSQWFKDHPETCLKIAEETSQWAKDHPDEIIIRAERMSATKQGQDFDIGEWTGFKYDEPGNERNLPEYRQWRESVFERDDYTCQQCKQRGVYIQAHHIYMWAKYPELRFDIDNGITLCKGCHKAVQGYEDKYIDMFIMLMN